MIPASDSPSLPARDIDAIAHNVALVRERVSVAARRVGRDPAGITLVAVSKTVPYARLSPIEATGITDLGENRVQEAAPKIEAIGRAVTWHLVGHLQRNKARAAVQLFDLIHSVDDVELAQTLDRHAAARGVHQRVLFQVNVTGEASKSGFRPDDLCAKARGLAVLPWLRPEGLMTIAPLGADRGEIRRVFAALRRLRGDLAPVFSAPEWRQLSMGMTDDYDIAVEEGATLVRVGRAIFGERPPATVDMSKGDKQ